jgi:hypothetical protein
MEDSDDFGIFLFNDLYIFDDQYLLPEMFFPTYN